MIIKVFHVDDSRLSVKAIELKLTVNRQGSMVTNRNIFSMSFSYIINSNLESLKLHKFSFYSCYPSSQSIIRRLPFCVSFFYKVCISETHKTREAANRKPDLCYTTNLIANQVLNKPF